MSTLYSPSIVRTGLEVYLDAANTKCYPGTGVNWTELSTNKLSSTDLDGALSIGDYTPSTAGSQVKAFIYPNAGTEYTTIPDNVAFDFRNTISWDFVACRETAANRQSIFAQINLLTPWNGMGVVSMSRDGNGQLAWWGGGSNAAWWDTGIALSNNKWWYCAGTWEGANRKVYARTVGDTDFTTAITAALGTFTGTSAANTFRLGDNGTDAASAIRIIDGAIGLLRIWSTQLSDADINQNFEAIRGRFGL